MALTELQRKQFVDKCNTLNIKTLITYIQSGEFTLEDLPNLSPERRAYIETEINKMPNQMEQNEWAIIQQRSSIPTEGLLQTIEAYIHKWESKRPASNHVDEAMALYAHVEEELNRGKILLEQNDWNSVDMMSTSSLLGHLSKYPTTAHLKEIDEAVWALVNKENPTELQMYTSNFPNGAHAGEAMTVQSSINEWQQIKTSGDMMQIRNYMTCNPTSPFIMQAQNLLASLKQNELDTMRRDAEHYEASRLFEMLDKGIFTENELYMAGVLTPQVMQALRQSSGNLPDVQKAINSSTAVCKPGHTDVFFLGIPSTGKTCVLMGLSNTPSININLAACGGDYAEALMLYTESGRTMPATPGSFVTTLEGTIKAPTGETHNVNLVEMSGEEFAFKIVNNPDHIFSFEDMGQGATELLRNDNRKLFFIVIDPTAYNVNLNRKVITGYDGNTGDPKYYFEKAVCNQRLVLRKLISLFGLPENREIMKKVDAIHFIMTKSDMLALDPQARKQEALNVFNANYSDHILGPLVDICQACNINVPTGFRPQLYTFSLGNFYIGKIFDYDPSDSELLANAIMNSTHGTKTQTWWNNFKKSVN